MHVVSTLLGTLTLADFSFKSNGKKRRVQSDLKRQITDLATD